MKLALAFCLIFISLSLFSQEIATDTILAGNKKSMSDYFSGANVVVGNIKSPPAFPGGKTALDSFIRKNINQATLIITNKAPSGSYNVIIRYWVNQDGSISNIGARTNCGYGMEDEVIKCLRLSPKWQPALNSKNETVTFSAKQMVTFVIKGANLNIIVK